ncbi:unnamed protein product [Peronospora belbahrii]|uniref:DNA ligase n=1 Tax=Peronospora belbahrii TaxID=622444 RepID=A0AAU9KP30_9STRA|nr:unnamed protein product [Peronospora belbahrii]
MAKNVPSFSKTQSSITSFFGATGALTTSVKKRKYRDDEKELVGNSTRLSTTRTKKMKDKPTDKNEKREAKKKEEEEEEKEDVEVQDTEEIEEEDEEKIVKSTTKPGRHRLRQCVVEEEEEEDSDGDLPMNTKEDKNKQKKVIDMTSLVSTTDIVAKKVKTTVEVNKSVKKKDAKDEEQEVQDAPMTKSIVKKNETTAVKTAFFTPVSSKATMTPTKQATNNNKNENSGAVQKQEERSDNPRKTPYCALAHLFAKIEEVSGRLVIQDLLTAFFRDVILRSPDDLIACIYLCVCVDLAPPFENLKIGIGDAILIKAIGEATGVNLKFIKEMYHKEGDLGKVAQNARSKQKTLSFTSLTPTSSNGNGLTVQYVYNQFVKISKMAGNNSQQQKCSIIKGLLVKCEKEKTSRDKDAQSAEGAKYIIRGLQGKLRIGLAEKSILMGLTYAFMTDEDYKDKDKQQEALTFVKKAFAECPSYNALVAAFCDVQKEVSSAPFLHVKDFRKVAEKCVLTPGTPVSPMLARPTKAYAMVFDRFEGKPFTCEYKYDGERAQIHILSNGEMAIFSRNFENSTERFPDVKLAISKAAKVGVVESCIVDAEVVAIDRATNKRLPFQILSTRSRKNVKVEDIKVPVCIYAFDLLFLNGKSFLSTPLAKRREKLREMFEVNPGNFEFATSLDVEDGVDVKDNPEAMEEAVDKVRNFLAEAVRENCEGLMVKTLKKEATYEPANRSHKWLKLKKDYLDGIGDSVDLVPIGAFHGRGKRTGVYGAYLLACYDPGTEMYQPITKLGTGLSDEVLKKFYDELKEKVVDTPPSDYAIGEGNKPDVWFEASCVWEILGADLSISPKYTAAIGLVAKDKGISLRFPRFLRIRDDKMTTQATNSSQIADLYKAQGLTTVTNGEDDECEGEDMLI